MTLSHTNPEGSLPVSATKEQLSKAYIHMVASAAGMDLGQWGMDYDGIDTTVRSSVDYGPGGLLGPGLDVQLKCTGQQSVDRDDVVAWSLKRKTFKLLSATNRSLPAIFCVMLVPDEPGYWLRHDDEGLLARSKMYYLRGEDFPPTTNRKSQTLHVPKQNRLTPTALLALMEESSQWWSR